MMPYLVRRLSLGLLTIWVLVTIVFVTMRLGGNPVDAILPEYATLEQRQALEQELGLDKPMMQQYRDYLRGLLTLDVGESLVYRGHTAADLYFDRLPATLKLGFVVFVVAVVVGVPLGLVAAVRPNSLVDRTIAFASFAALSVPYFWVALMLIIVFSMQLNLLPPSGNGSWKHYIMPTVAAGLVPTARITQVTLTTLLDVLEEDYIRTARAKGLRESTVLFRHAMRNAAVVQITMIAWEFTRLATGGLIVVEVIFVWNGIGSLTIQAAQSSDFPLVQLAVVLTGVIVVLTNVVVDFLYVAIDPRIRVAR